MVIKCLFVGARKKKIVRFVLKCCTFRFRDYITLCVFYFTELLLLLDAIIAVASVYNKSLMEFGRFVSL